MKQITLVYTMIIRGEITVPIADDATNPTLEAMREARRLKVELPLRSALFDPKETKEADSDNHNATASA